MPQPNLVPVSPTKSRSAHNSGISATVSRDVDLPFNVKSIFIAGCPVGVKGDSLRRPSSERTLERQQRAELDQTRQQDGRWILPRRPVRGIHGDDRVVVEQIVEV